MRSSEWILDEGGHAYHLGITRNEAADLILLVGDPARVPLVSSHFDEVFFVKQKREFLTHVGRLNGKKIMAMSTGMGGGNIEIALNELDALQNLNTDLPPKQITLIRLGTSGAINPNIEVGEVVVSEFAIGLDGLMRFYPEFESDKHPNVNLTNFAETLQPLCYAVECNKNLLDKFEGYRKAITCSLPGFYAPQGRQLRFKPLDMLSEFHRLNIDNLEMETSMIYAMSKLFDHAALSFNLILANRNKKTFADDPKSMMNNFLTNFFNQLKETL